MKLLDLSTILNNPSSQTRLFWGPTSQHDPQFKLSHTYDPDSELINSVSVC